MADKWVSRFSATIVWGKDAGDADIEEIIDMASKTPFAEQ